MYIYTYTCIYTGISLVTQLVKKASAMQVILAQFLGREDAEDAKCWRQERKDIQLSFLGLKSFSDSPMSSKSGSKVWVCSPGQSTLERKKDRNPTMNVQSFPRHLPARKVSASPIPALWQVFELVYWVASVLSDSLRCSGLGSGRSPEEGIGYPLQHSCTFLVAQLVKNLPAMQETWVRSLGWEGPLEKGMAAHSSVLAWWVPWTVYSMGSQRVGHDWATFTFHTYMKLLYMYKLYICIIIYIYYIYIFTVPQGLWDLSSLTRKWTHTLYSVSAES